MSGDYYVYNKETGLKVGNQTFSYHDANRKANLANARSGRTVFDSIRVSTYNGLISKGYKPFNGMFRD